MTYCPLCERGHYPGWLPYPCDDHRMPTEAYLLAMGENDALLESDLDD